jgi:hypothetical protein
MQMTVKALRAALDGLDDDLPVFFRRVAPVCGNIEEAGRVEVSTYAFFGIENPCAIIEPMADEDDEEGGRA